MKIATLAFGGAILGGAGFLPNGLPDVAQASDMTVYKSDSCGCCGGWVEHMSKAGYAIRVVPTDDLAPVKVRLGVPESLWSCHTAVVDGKVIEGHVPAAAVDAFLKSPGASRGIGVPGMPTGSPGMESIERLRTAPRPCSGQNDAPGRQS
ncbi:DUF411 domain-containing protein [Brevundimonas sp. NPDC028983]